MHRKAFEWDKLSRITHHSRSRFENDSRVINVESLNIVDKLDHNFLSIKSVVGTDICSSLVSICVTRERKKRCCPFLSGITAELDGLSSEAVVIADEINDEIFQD